MAAVIIAGFYYGLSPRVRGNRVQGAGIAALVRSIPACAGEPDVGSGKHIANPVYPRVCGGTSGAASRGTASGGLSPRVRGNLLHECHFVSSSGSIPACAGEPWPSGWP